MDRRVSGDATVACASTIFLFCVCDGTVDFFVRAQNCSLLICFFSCLLPCYGFCVPPGGGEEGGGALKNIWEEDESPWALRETQQKYALGVIRPSNDLGLA